MREWLIFVLPVVGMALGLVSGWLYLRLLFGPLPFGGRWGPALARDAGRVLDRLAEGLERMLPLGEFFRLMQPEKVAATVTRSVLAGLDRHVDEVMRERYAVLWDNLPHSARARVYSRVGRQLPSLFDNMVEDLAEHLDELTDLRYLLRGMIQAQPDLLGRLLAEALYRERVFLLGCAALIGLAVGGAQCLVWQSYPLAWLQVTLVGGLALAAVLLPRALLSRFGRLGGGARPFGQGLATVLSRRLSRDVFNAGHLLHAVVTGQQASRTRSIIRRHMRPLLETGLVRTTLQLLLGAEGYVYMKQSVTERLTTLTLGALEAGSQDALQGDRIEMACRERLQAMPPAEVHALLQPVLDEGLWWRLLVVVGLGCLLGLAEALVLLAGG